MKHYWLVKTEPHTYSWSDLASRGDSGDIWDGVRNHQAARYLREMEAGDAVFVYHSGAERAVVGLAEVSAPAFPDKTDASGRFVAVMLRALERLPAAVTLAQIKADPALVDMLLLRQARLSVMPVAATAWNRILQLARDA